jgi:rhodanese-related sulfurtransferase
MESKPIIIDVRNETEFDAEHINGAINVPLDYLNYNLNSFPKEQPFIIHCAGGYRSMIAASILKARGYHNMINVEKGMGGIRTTDVPLTAYICPSTLK